MTCPRCCGDRATDDPPTCTVENCPRCSLIFDRRYTGDTLSITDYNASTAYWTTARDTSGLCESAAIDPNAGLPADFPYAAPAMDQRTPTQLQAIRDRKLRARARRQRTKWMAKASKKRNRS